MSLLDLCMVCKVGAGVVTRVGAELQLVLLDLRVGCSMQVGMLYTYIVTIWAFDC